MTKETYLKMTQPFRDNPKRAKSLHICNKILAAAVFVAYPLLVVWLFMQRSPAVIKAVLVPLDGFLVISVVRCLINRPRPYEKYEVAPVIPKETRGKSCPSRHVFSAAVIALTFLAQPGFLPAGILLLIAAAAIPVIRVVSGVHCISDVRAAWGFAALAWLIGFYVF